MLRIQTVLGLWRDEMGISRRRCQRQSDPYTVSAGTEAPWEPNQEPAAPSQESAANTSSQSCPALLK
ncbi:rCG59632 [Rattus norvegicus]|uniref:RCG59632 n=1 Tax=Rattus norvegicus TaxID=10116 RepID=A6HRM7_RAT|nr:rCG59632 [Rattus norvegicus]